MSEERRREERRALSSGASTTVVTCEFEELIGKSFDGETVDVSRGSLRLRLDQPVPVGGQLDIWVDRLSGEGRFYLTGHVRWAEDMGAGFHVGVQLFEGAATDIDDWHDEMG